MTNVYMSRAFRESFSQLSHGQSVMIKGREFIAGSVVGYAIECNRDPYEAVVQNEAHAKENPYQKYNTHWLNPAPVCLSDSKELTRRDMQRRANAPKLDLDQIVYFEGNLYKLVKAPNDNVELERVPDNHILNMQRVMKI